VLQRHRRCVRDPDISVYTRLGFVPVEGAAAASFATLSEECDLAYRLELGGDGPAR
jgi:hypothetical protein